MSRVTAPMSKIARALSSSPSSTTAARSARDGSAHSAGAALMPKYAELLRNRRSNEHSDASVPLWTASPCPLPPSSPWTCRGFPEKKNGNLDLMCFSRSSAADAVCLVIPRAYHYAPADAPAFPCQPQQTSDADVPLLCPLGPALFVHTHRCRCAPVNELAHWPFPGRRRTSCAAPSRQLRRCSHSHCGRARFHARSHHRRSRP